MKNLNILLAFIITFMFFGCEKEQTTNPNSTALNKTKSNYSIEKSEEDLFTEVMGFIEATTNHTLIENLNAQDALLFTEAAMNYRLTNDEHLPSESKSFSLNYEVEVLTDGVDLYIEANEIQAMNDYIYDFIYQEAEDYVFENGNKDGKIISIVDFKIENLNAGLYSIAVEYTFSNFSSTPLPASCDVNLSWYPVMNDGGCNGNPANSDNATQEISRLVNSKNCNQNLSPNCPFPLWFDVKSIVSVDPHFSKYTSKSLWKGLRNECLSPLRINELKDSCIWIGEQTNIDYWPNYKLKNILISYGVLTGGTSSSWVYNYMYYFGNCLGNTYAYTNDLQYKVCFGC